MSVQYLKIDSIHLFLWMLLMYILSKFVVMKRDELVQGKEVERCTPFYAVLIFLPIFVMAVFGRPRADTFLYLREFRDMPVGLRAGWELVLQSDRPGFTLFTVLIKNLFGENITIYRAAIALVHSIPLIAVFRKYSEDYLFSIFLFLASGMHLAWMMNGMRQFMAVSIIFTATPWILEGKYLKTILVIIIAASIHSTAIFMIPVIFIIHGEAWNRRTILYIIIVLAVSVFFAGNSRAFNEIVSTLGYSTDWAISMGDDGANPIRILVNSVPTGLALLSFKELKEEEDVLANCCINMSIITVGLYVLATFTSGVMTGRMPIYTNLYSFILLPYVIRVYFIGNNAKVVKIVAVLAYLLYFTLQY